jgi:anti-anti-sigma factor
MPYPRKRVKAVLWDRPHLSIDVRREGGLCVLVLRGELDRFAVPLLEGMVDVVDDQAERLVLDLAGLTFMDCHGARAIAQAGLRAGAPRPAIVRSLSPAARRMFDLLGLELPHHRRDDAAVPATGEQLRRRPGRRAPGERGRRHRAA